MAGLSYGSSIGTMQNLWGYGGTSYGSNVPTTTSTGADPVWDFSSILGSLNLGVPVTSATGASQGVNTAQIDGSSDFIDKLAGFGSALLGSIGVRNDAGTVAQPVAYQPQQSSFMGFPPVMLFAALGVGAYLVFKK